MKKLIVFITLLTLLFGSVAMAADKKPTLKNGNYKVTSVVDGDTFKIAVGKSTENVRLIGVDTPETVHPTKPVEYYGKEASIYTKKLLTGKTVTLVFDVQQRDKYGRLLAYVYLADGTFVNSELIKNGYAVLLTIPPNVKHTKTFTALQKEARDNKRGLWADNNKAESKPATGVKYDPNGPDRDCTDFDTEAEAQAFFIAAGGPDKDPHRLDRDKDGAACEKD
ncbi:thermonuclease family protein [Paenibacillus gansuensis]|uniref:Thermonuclease family protein n=1 Tax=Paenibacillus gansuensis TaxID=306542 RepID=A0ABW5PJP2_9BACL